MGGCEPRIEVIVKNATQSRGWGRSGEAGRGWVVGGLGWTGDGGRGFRGCEPKIEGIVKRA